MSEREPVGAEKHVSNQETVSTPERHKASPEQIASAEKKQKEVVHEMEQKTEALAHSSKDIQIQSLGENKPQASHSFGVHKQLKLDSYKRVLGRIQTRLKGPEKGFSKVIHSKQVETVSAVGAKTIARPIGVLTGGLSAFLGSTVVLVMAKHYGFTYNFSLFVILFVGGYLVGTILEALSKSVAHLKKK